MNQVEKYRHIAQLKNDFFSGVCPCGPGYASPQEAIQGPKEKICYVVCVRPDAKETGLPDYLATVDVDPTSPTYSQVRNYRRNVSITRVGPGKGRNRVDRFLRLLPRFSLAW